MSPIARLSLCVKSGIAAAALLGSSAAFAQSVNVTAQPATTTLPDGTTVQMWGYNCGAAVSGSTTQCAALNSAANTASGQWSPIVIRVAAPTDSSGNPQPAKLTINLTNNLLFGTNAVPTSMVIVGQIGGGLGGPGTRVASPVHAPQSVTWAVAGNSQGAQFNPPSQPGRIQSFGTEVEPVAVGSSTAATALTWNNLQPGTYLLESGTHPSIQGPMGLYGVVIVTAPSVAASGSATGQFGAAYKGVTYDADVPVVMSEIDAAQNNAVNVAVNSSGFNENAVVVLRNSLQSVNIDNGGKKYSVGDVINITGGSGSGANATVQTVDGSGAITAIMINNAGTGYTSVPQAVAHSASGTGAKLTAVLALAGDVCVGPSGSTSACYPPAVNYNPLYFLMNGVAFDKTNVVASTFPAVPNIPTPSLTGVTNGKVLVRLVNAGLRMHVPSMVGSVTGNPAVGGFALIAEDGNLLPGVPRVQSEVFMAAGKTYDVMINGPSSGAPALPLFDRELSLSGNAVNRDAGMLAYIGVNGATPPASPATAAAQANPDTYQVIPGNTLNVADPSKGVIANDVNIYGVRVTVAPTQGTLTMNANGTFTYVPMPSWAATSSPTTADSFQYCGNNSSATSACTTVSLNVASLEAAGGIVVANSAFKSNISTLLAVPPPGVLAYDTDGAGYPLSVTPASIAVGAGMTVSLNADGSFNATAAAPGTYTFAYAAQNSQGTISTGGNTPVACSLTPNGSGNSSTSGCALVTVTFPVGSGIQVSLIDGSNGKPFADGSGGNGTLTNPGDYRWIIEEDRTFFVDPNCAQNPPPAGCPGSSSGIVPTYGTNFHTSDMPFVAQGCTGPMSCEGGQMMYDPTSGNHIPAVCDVGNGVCRADPTGNGHTVVLPGQVALDPTKRYYISVLPGDAANPFAAGYAGQPCASATPTSSCAIGYGMGGAPIAAGQTTVTVPVQPSPFPPGELSVFVFEDDFPLNGEVDSGGGVDVLAPLEPGLGGFQIHLWDAMGGNGDFTGQMTYDMFNQPLTNGLDGTLDPATGFNACPITQQGVGRRGAPSGNGGITGMIVTCPKYEGDGKTLSPLAGQAVIKNLMPGRFGVIATPAADRIARGEEWLQTNTLDGQKAHDTFIRIGEPEYFQEYGPANFHVTIGFANPAIINARKASVCSGNDIYLPGQSNCSYSITGKVTAERMSRTPDERLYSSGSHDSFYWTQCYVSFGDPDGEDFAFTKCNEDGTFTLNNLPQGSWRVTVFDQWNDMLVDGLSTPVALNSSSTNNTCPGPKTTAITNSGGTCDLGDIATNQWQANVYTKTFIDDDESGVGTDKDGIPLIDVAVRYRDGSLANNLGTDFGGIANFNETFPLFNWYVVETDVTRYKNTGTHSVYDSGGPADGTTACGPGTPGAATTTSGYPPCGNSTIGHYLANTAETVSVPRDLRVPGAVYCAGADCSGKSVMDGAASSADPSTCTPNTNGDGGYTCSNILSTGRIDPPWFAGTEGYQGFSGENNFLEFGKHPYEANENGGIRGHVVYASTRPFDDPQLDVQLQWEPLIAHVTINLYKEGTAPDGTASLTLVDSTQTSSWDDWAQGFRRVDSNGHIVTSPTGGALVMSGAGGGAVTNMSCPGQSTADLFYFTLFNQPMYLDLYNNVQHGSGAQAAPTAIAYNAQFKCYDGLHAFNQLQPAPYDGMYSFPSVTSYDASSGKPTGTNCTICTANPAKDLYSGLPMLPPGKYVVEVVMPPGYEIVKEEDKNILIGDNFIAPATQEIGGLGNIFIIPDQASVASDYAGTSNAYNANNPQNPTQSLGASPITSTVPAFTVEPVWPCVGASRIVPDYISLFPQTTQVSPFAGATRNLCDRKEVTLADQAAVTAKFYVFTSTHKAAKFTGVITDDFTSEFDPFSPQFGEKFSPPNMPVAIKDWSGTEISRVYSDQWGDYNGMTYSTWEVNPPNPTGYAPSMMVFCMNDPGTGSSPDPLFNSLYSQFCYELPFMPGQTQYLDTPVVPTAAYVGAGYNNPDCAYPDATPAVSSVYGDKLNNGNGGPWVQKAGNTLTINSLGNLPVNNYGYAGPAASQAPFNQKTVTRHYGFGTQCTTPDGSATCSTASSVTIGGKTAVIQSWSDTQIVVTVPTGVANCAVQQQTIYGGSTAQCGELSVVAGNGKSTIDAVTVTIGGKTPTVVASTAPLSPTSPGAIQIAIDAASPGDLIIVPPGTYQEMLLMWKPVRLQGVGAASSIINANTQPAGKLDPWRAMVSCLFGLTRSGTPIGQPSTNGGSVQFDPDGVFTCPANGKEFVAGDTWNAFTQVMTARTQIPQIDRLPLEGIVGWDTTTNGNLAQLLQEPTLMGAYEGAAITVLSKGVYTAGLVGYFGSGSEATFPTGARVLTANDCLSGGNRGGAQTNPYPSNFLCNPSSIDGLSMTDASQGGGGVFVHAWGHNLQIANNRVYNNIGTLSGGINIGQGESPDAYLAGTTGDTDPGSCQTSNIANKQLPYCFDMNVNVHHNLVTANTSIGDELFSGTPAGAGGVSFCTGADYYKFNYNWLCGNMSTGDGGGFAHIGFIYNGDVEHNWILFNQSSNPTIQTNGGGILVMGAAPDGTVNGVECGGTAADADCTPGLPDGTGPGMVINANLILGNTASSGSGGGLRLQSVNGTEIANFPRNTSVWNDVTVTNNIIVNNVAGWDGGGVSLQDALRVSMVNNTIASNDTTASAGPLFNTIGAPLASAPGATNQTTSKTSSAPQPAGLVAMQNSVQLMASLPAGGISCPANNPNCGTVSFPYLANDLFWQNRAFFIGVGSLSNAYQQNIISIFNASFNGSGVPQSTGTAPTSQSATDAVTANGNGATISGGTGACVSGSTYWDIGFRGDPGPGNAGITIGTTKLHLAPVESGLTNASENVGSNATTNLIGTNPDLVSQYCNGSRTPPEAAAGLSGWWKLSALGWQVPPGISDASVPNPIFNLSPSATVDEGNNWVNLNWGPLSLNNPVSGVLLGNYALAQGSPDIDYIHQANGTSPAAVAYHAAPTSDFFGNPRPGKNSTSIDIGAVEFQGAAVAVGAVSPSSLAFGNVVVGTTSAAKTLTLTNSGGAPINNVVVTVTAPFSQSGGTCAATLAAGSACTINVVYAPTATGGSTGSVTVSGSVAITGSPVSLTGTGVAAVNGASLTPATWTVSQTRNCPGSGLGILACLFDPAQAFTLTNTGNVALTVNSFGLTGTAANDANYAISGLLTSCANGQSLVAGASCVVTVQFKPLTAQAAGAKPAGLSINTSAGTESVVLNGTAR
ncbi:MAG TPA: choice-of-anchor D domain-containing protein [Steroidobacteraceae bacterium]|jgi:hypothetical protein